MRIKCLNPIIDGKIEPDVIAFNKNPGRGSSRRSKGAPFVQGLLLGGAGIGKQFGTAETKQQNRRR